MPERAGFLLLEDMVFFPGRTMPLHIFEPRYRVMLEEALRGGRCFGLTRPDPQQPGRGRDPVAGMGVIRACVRHADGSAHLVLCGQRRVRITDWEEQAPYPMAVVEPLRCPRGGRVAWPGELSERLRQLPGVDWGDLAAVDGMEAGEVELLVDRICDGLIGEVEERLEVLSCADFACRINKLLEFLRKNQKK